VPAGDLRDHDGKPLDPNRGELHHLRRQGLVDTVPSPGRDRSFVALTDRGRQLLDRRRPHDLEAGVTVRDGRSTQAQELERGQRQEFYSGIRQPRELEHDAKVYAAYLVAAERLQEQGARIRRLVLDLGARTTWLPPASRCGFRSHPEARGTWSGCRGEAGCGRRERQACARASNVQGSRSQTTTILTLRNTVFRLNSLIVVRLRQ
jgi:DNA-binding PadR family transcriptional regulator